MQHNYVIKKKKFKLKLEEEQVKLGRNNNNDEKPPLVLEDEVSNVISMMTGIPLAEKLQNLKRKKLVGICHLILSKFIIGQN